MHSDKLFTAYAITLFSIFAAAITASVMAGFATLPSAGIFLEHLLMSVGIRTAYKSFGSVEWIDSFARAIGFVTEAAENAAGELGTAAEA